MESYFCAVLNKLKYFLRYLHYYFTAGTKHAVHSPFMFDLVTTVINGKTKAPVFDTIEKKRETLLQDHSVLNVTDFGTAFGGNKTYKRKISAIAKYSAKPEKYARLLYRIVNHYKPSTMLELGTSLGISTLYQAAASGQASFITLEGCSETARIAKENFREAGFKNIEVITGDFQNTLPVALDEFNTLDYVFFDGHHSKIPTLNYFEQCLKKSNDKSIFIFDDINWSDDMQAAWIKIKNHPRVIVTVDLFMLGIVFFNPELSRQHFTIRF